MANERITENIVRDHFKSDPLYKSVKFEEQKSYCKRITELLQGASKSGKGIGKPEFIVSFPSASMDYILVIECKASCSFHRSSELNRTKDYAVDGVLHYAKNLSKQFDVIAIGVSGQTIQELMVSNFLWKKGEDSYLEVINKELLSINSYLKFFNNEQFADNLRNINIIQQAIDLNDEYQAYSITEITRCTMVSAILLSLLDEPFRDAYKKYSTSESLGKAMLAAIENVLSGNEVRNKNEMIGEYSKILNEPIFKQSEIKHKNKKERESSISVAKEIIERLHRNVYPLIDMEQSGFDVLGRFYTEFIRYAGSEQSQGLVLTPFHITDLFCDLADVKVNDVIYDPCCGTGGFLIAGMKRMFQLAGGDDLKKQSIKSHQLVGVELRPSMFTYACSNMMMRGDGKSNIYCGDCFALESIVKENHKPTVSFLNPPYDVGTAGQMLFIEHALNMVSSQNGTVVAIVQMSCAIKNEKELIAVKKRILEKHYLKAVLSMPDDLFYPVAVPTCIMVFKANEQNIGRKTWFGYFKDDGFEKRKHRGRIDVRNRWNILKTRWKIAYDNLDEVSGLSIKKEVNHLDEWCSEAYLETNYKLITQTDFEIKIRDYLAFNIVANIKVSDNTTVGESFLHSKFDLNTDNWEWFRFDKIFKICKGFYNKKPETEKNGNIPFVGASDSNNGITSWHTVENIEESSKTGDMPNADISEKIFEPNCITVSNNGSVGFAFYQPIPFTCTHDVNPLYLQNRELNKYIALFLCVLIEQEQYRWAYGRKWRPKRMPDSMLKLPVTTAGNIDWSFMERYIKSLPYSANL